MCDLVRFVRHADLAKDFFHSLAHHGSDPARAAWFLERSRAWSDVHHPPEHETNRRSLADAKPIRSAASILRATLVASERSPTCWRDTLAAVGALA